MLKTLARIPWIFTIIIYLVVVHQLKISLEGGAGYIFMGLCVFILFIEFVKSGDIGVLSFFLDNLYSVLAIIAATGLLSYLFFALKEQPTFFHWFGYAIVVGDALFSPTNAFRTALRNFGGSVN